MTKRKLIIRLLGLVRTFLLLAAGAGLFSLLLLLAVPADKKNALILGYSFTRLAMLAFVFVGILLFLGLLVTTYRKPGWVRGRVDQLRVKIQTPGIPGFYLFMLPLLITLGGLLFIFRTLRTTDLFFRSYLIRLAPIVIWFTALGVLALFLLICLGYRRKTLLLNIHLAFSTFRVWLRRANLYKVLGISILLSVLCLGFLYRFLPAYRRWFLAEDQFLENIETGLFFASFLLSALILIINRGGRIIDFTIPAASLLSFMEEISYGERFFESIPMIDPDKGVDALHDFFKIGFQFIRKQENDLVFYLIGGLLLIAVLLVGCFVVQRFLKRRYDQPWVIFGPLIFTLISFTFILFSLVLDLDVIDIPEHRFIEELLELFAALALFFGAISIYQRIALEDRSREPDQNPI